MQASVTETPYFNSQRLAGIFFQFTKIGRNLLVTCVDIAFEHDATNAFVAIQDLRHAVMQNEGLKFVVLHTVGVRAVHDDALSKTSFFKCLFSEHDAHGVVVGSTATATKHKVTIAISQLFQVPFQRA